MPKLKTTIEIEIEIEFDYQKAEQATKDSPGCPEEVFLTQVSMNLPSGPGDTTAQECFLDGHSGEIEDLIWANRGSWEED